MASIFQRLIGLETEYAVRFRPNDPCDSQLSKFQLYSALVSSLRNRILAVEAKHFKEGIFTASGGAVWFEAEKPSGGGGLVEGATPECRGPRQLLTYQRAQDRLLSEAATSAGTEGLFQLVKNDRDGFGNVYGAQENYEAVTARGWRLGMWRLGLIALLPLVLLTWLGFFLLICGTLLYLAVAAVVFVPLQLFTRNSKPLALMMFGGDLVEGKETGSPAPAWLESLVLAATRVLSAPLAGALMVLSWLTLFHDVRQKMLAFLVSRAVMTGSGMIDSDGAFHLADKAAAINCVLGYGGFLGDRPIFTLGHFFKAICVESFFSPRDYLDLMSNTGRLQIGLGDSNMTQSGEYLRIATTLLILDGIEAGQLNDLPRVRKPIAALHAICADPTLRTEVELKDGRRMTALQIQRIYLDACYQFVQQADDPPAEVYGVLRLWDETLEQLEDMQEMQVIPMSLVGGVDWVSKKYLVDNAGDSATWSERKKIDLRYHELSSDGYYNRLARTGVATVVVDDEEIERAMRSAPANTPATTRGHYIREFAQGDEQVTVNWKSVIIGQGFGAKVIRLSKYGQPRDRVDDNNVRSPAV